MKNLRDQDGCWNCKFWYVWCQQDDPDTWYCNITQDRPHSGVLIHDMHKFDHTESHLCDMDGKQLPDAEIIRRMDAWKDWSEGKEVHPYQICDCYIQEK